MTATLYTIGYKYRPTPADLVVVLREHGIRVVHDVRDSGGPAPQWQPGALHDALLDADIGYQHWHGLGNPAAIRAKLNAGMAVPDVLEYYRAWMLRHANEHLDRLAEDLARPRIACLLCACPDALDADDDPACHRAIIADELLRRGAVSEIIHLAAALPAKERRRLAAAQGRLL